MSNNEFYSWPARSTLTFTNRRGKIYFRSKDRQLDLADSLMLNHPRESRTVYMSLSTKAVAWEKWDKANVQSTERRIRYSICFDGYWLSITRLSPVRKPAAPCTEEFRWKLRIQPAISKGKFFF